jgi:23S rRNA pseudouridine2605 synthase/23S rRNA pseudouridine2604 synthase
MSVRLNKYLASCGVASRRAADKLILEERVRLNGKKVMELGVQVNPEKDVVEVDGRPVRQAKRFIYVALHKPKNYVSSAQRTKQAPDIVLDLISIKERLYPVGRLDKDTTGLLLLSNDGDFTFRLTHPSGEGEKEYIVSLTRPINDIALSRLRSGVTLWGEKTLPPKITVLTPRKLSIVLKEGKNRQIRRILEKVGYTVESLKRIRIKTLPLGALPMGQWRMLTPAEVKELMK